MLVRISADKITELFLPIGTLTCDISMSTFIPFLSSVMISAKAVSRLFEKVGGWKVKLALMIKLLVGCNPVRQTLIRNWYFVGAE
jgi:hypothetical protein